MASSNGDIFGGLASSAVSALSSIGNAFLTNSLTRSTSKKQTNWSTASTKDILDYSSDLNRKDYDWQKAKDFEYDSNQYYNLAQRYAENSAAWSVQGLKNAGLNPILAASNGNFDSTYGTGSSGGSMAHASGSISAGSGGHASPSNGVDLSESIRDVSAAFASEESAEQMHTDTQTKKALRDPTVASAHADAYNKAMQGQILEAERDKIDAERGQILANTAHTLADTQDIKAGKSVQSWSNVAARIVNGLGFDDSAERDNKENDATAQARLKSFFRHSAKDAIEEMRRQDAIEKAQDSSYREFQERQRKKAQDEVRGRRHSIMSVR